MFKTKDCQGITLIEFMVTLSIIVILTVAAIPTFITLLQNYRLSGTAESLYYALQYARVEAIKRNTNVYFAFTTGTNWCYGINAGSTCDCTVAGSCALGSVSTLSANQISLSASGYGGNNLYFESTHGAASASGSITLTTYGTSTLITTKIGVLGNLQTCSTGISGYTAC